MKKEQLELENSENDTETTNKKKIGIYGYDLTNTQWRRIAVDANGRVKVTT
jgi:hypothetical protein